MRFTLILSLLLSLLVVVFAALNNESMTVNFGLFETIGPKALVLIVTFIVGVLVGVLASIPSLLKARKKMKHLQRQLEPPPVPQDESASASPFAQPSSPHTSAPDPFS